MTLERHILHVYKHIHRKRYLTQYIVSDYIRQGCLDCAEIDECYEDIAQIQVHHIIHLIIRLSRLSDKMAPIGGSRTINHEHCQDSPAPIELDFDNLAPDGTRGFRLAASSTLRQPLLAAGHPLLIRSASRASSARQPVKVVNRENETISYYATETMFGRGKNKIHNFQTDIVHPTEIDGCQAWIMLACVFIINANTLGSLKIYGLIFEDIVAQKYYNREEASWPISTASTIQNLAGLLTPLLALKISWRSIEIIQTLLFVAANVGAYFSRSLALDIFCIGVIQGVAFSLRYNMNVVINNEYFVKYRATAMGISLAGSTCGVFVLKPLISYVLDSSHQQFRNAYLTLGIIMSFNIILNLLIRKPKADVRPDSPDSQGTEDSFGLSEDGNSRDSVLQSLAGLLKNPSIHCIWIMQTIYFYISRTYTIFIVDYGADIGFSRQVSRNLLEFWVYGEITGRLLLGGLIDSRVMSLKWNLVAVNLLLAASGFALLLKPSAFGILAQDDDIGSHVASDSYYAWFFGISLALVAALSSLLNMLIVPFGQEYLGKKNVPWAFAMGSVVTSLFLLLRPSLIGLSRDHYKSYDLLIIVMSLGPSLYAILFVITEPFLSRRKYEPPATVRAYT